MNHFLFVFVLFICLLIDQVASQMGPSPFGPFGPSSIGPNSIGMGPSSPTSSSSSDSFSQISNAIGLSQLLGAATNVMNQAATNNTSQQTSQQTQAQTIPSSQWDQYQASQTALTNQRQFQPNERRNVQEVQPIAVNMQQLRANNQGVPIN